MKNSFSLTDLHCICDSGYYTKKKKKKSLSPFPKETLDFSQSQITRVAITIFHYLWIKVIKINEQKYQENAKMSSIRWHGLFASTIH